MDNRKNGKADVLGGIDSNEEFTEEDSKQIIIK
jgi:hypothetical protein